MKKINLICFIASLLLVTTSCDDFLNVYPLSKYTVEDGYNTQDDFEQAISAVYAKQQTLFNTNSCMFVYQIHRSDDTRNANNVSRFVDSSQESIYKNAWAIYWSMINRSNIIIDRIDDATFSDEDMRSYIKGEAYMLRAYASWCLGWQWGGMPLITSDIELDELRQVKRSTQDETLTQAENDYLMGYELLPESWDSSNAGRVTKYAAAGMLGRLYMFQHRYDDAATYLKEVIDQEGTLYKMATNYEDCFLDSHDNDSERVWEVQFTGGNLGEGNSFITGLIPETANAPNGNPNYVIPFSGYSGNMRSSLALFNAYETSPKVDLRKAISVAEYVQMSGVYDAVSKLVYKYIRYDLYEPQAKNDWANNLPILRYTDVKMMYAEALNEISYQADEQWDAFVILNAVRARAGLDPYTVADLPDKDSFFDAIVKERRVEFAFEGQRWRDLIRWGVAVDVMNEHFLATDENSGTYSVEPYRLLFPIPYSELSAYNDESVMWQNPSY